MPAQRESYRSSSPNDENASSSSKQQRPSPTSSSRFYAFGFFLCMVLMELALEGANDAFPDLVALPYAVTLFQFGFCFALPILVSRGKSLETFPTSIPSALPYVSLSGVVFGSTFLASLSVRYVSYPTKIVFKSAKLIPTMIVATILNPGKTFGLLEYASAVLLCAGAAGYGFDSGGGGAAAASNGGKTSYVGISCLLVSIFCDAFTPNLQQRLMAPPTNTTLPTTTAPQGLPPNTTISKSWLGGRRARCASLFFPASGGVGLSAQELMTNANGVGFAGLVVWMALNGTLWEGLGTAFRYPLLAMYLVAVGLTLSMAVFCYTRLIQESGSVVAVTVATLRKVATVVLSYIVYPKPISSVHIASGFVVLGGILLSNYSKRRSARAK